MEDEEKLWNSGVLNTTTAQGLSFAVFFYAGKVFGIRGGSEHHQLVASQFNIYQSATGEYIEYTERRAKNSQGGAKQKARPPPRTVQHYAVPGVGDKKCSWYFLKKIPRYDS